MELTLANVTQELKERKIQELLRLQGPRARLKETLFPAQREFIDDPSLFKAAFCTRRAGKSHSCGVDLITTADESEGENVIYFGLTRETAKAVMWTTLHDLNRNYQLGLEFNETALVATLPNRSRIKLMGADATKDEIMKALGQHFKKAVIDEGQAFGPQLKELCYDILLAALGEKLGTLQVIGTPGPAPAGFFFEVTSRLERTYPWSVHSWTWKENPAVRDNMQRQVDMMLEHNPDVVKTPAFRRNYLGEWVIDESDRVYRFDESRNVYDGPLPVGRWTYVLGVDLGFTDDTAFVLGAYSPGSPAFWIVEAYKSPGLDFYDVGHKIKDYQRRYSIAHVVIDGANKQGVATMENRFGLKLETAEKTAKADYIELMNGEMAQGYVRAPRGCAVIPEWQTLVWDKSGSRRHEDERIPNHLADSCLYAWRFAYNFAYRAPGALPAAYGSPEWFSQEEERMLRSAKTELRKQQNQLQGGFR